MRTISERIVDTTKTLDQTRDVWLASGRKDGSAHLIPVSIWWDGVRILLATYSTSVTARSAKRTGTGRLATPSPSNVIIIDATAEVIPFDQADDAFHAAFVRGAGWDPAEVEGEFVYIAYSPTRILAWQSVEEETSDREIMVDGRWLSERAS
jgi:hypothetical protein